MAEVRPGARLDSMGFPLADGEADPMRATHDMYGQPLAEGEQLGSTGIRVSSEESPPPPTAVLPTSTSGEALLIPHSSGVSSTAIAPVRMDIDGLRTFANRDLQSIYEDAQGLLQKFNELPVYPNMFSDAVLPMELAHQLIAVHDILGAGLRGVAADIDRFGDNLRTAANEQQRSDEAAEEALLRATKTFGEGGSEATRAFDAASAQRRDTAPAAPPADAAPAAPAPAEPAAQPPPQGAGGGGGGGGGGSY